TSAGCPDDVFRRPIDDSDLANRSDPRFAAALDTDPVSRQPRNRRPAAAAVPCLPDRRAGAAALSRPQLPATGAGRGPLCRDRPGDARWRRLGRATSPGRTVSRQAAVALLAGRTQLQAIRYPRV